MARSPEVKRCCPSPDRAAERVFLTASPQGGFGAADQYGTIGEGFCTLGNSIRAAESAGGINTVELMQQMCKRSHPRSFGPVRSRKVSVDTTSFTEVLLLYMRNYRA